MIMMKKKRKGKNAVEDKEGKYTRGEDGQGQKKKKKKKNNKEEEKKR